MFKWRKKFGWFVIASFVVLYGLAFAVSFAQAQEIQPEAVPFTFDVGYYDLSPNGVKVAATDFREIEVYDLVSQQIEEAELPAACSSLSDLAVFDDGTLALGCYAEIGDHQRLIINGQKVREYVPDQFIWSMQTSSDGRLAVSVRGYTDSVEIWAPMGEIWALKYQTMSGDEPGVVSWVDQELIVYDIDGYGYTAWRLADTVTSIRDEEVIWYDPIHFCGTGLYWSSGDTYGLGLGGPEALVEFKLEHPEFGRPLWYSWDLHCRYAYVARGGMIYELERDGFEFGEPREIAWYNLRFMPEVGGEPERLIFIGEGYQLMTVEMR